MANKNICTSMRKLYVKILQLVDSTKTGQQKALDGLMVDH